MLLSKNSPSVMQERILLSLFTLELMLIHNNYSRVGGSYVGALFSGSEINRLLGGQWSTYRRNEMEKMVGLGMCEKVSLYHAKSKKFKKAEYRITENWFNWCFDAYAVNAKSEAEKVNLTLELPF